MNKCLACLLSTPYECDGCDATTCGPCGKDWHVLQPKHDNVIIACPKCLGHLERPLSMYWRTALGDYLAF